MNNRTVTSLGRSKGAPEKFEIEMVFFFDFLKYKKQLAIRFRITFIQNKRDIQPFKWAIVGSI